VGGGATLVLDSGAGSVTGLGAVGTFSGGEAGTFSGFGDYAVGARSSFTLAGTDKLLTGDTLADFGALGVSGALTLNAGSTVTIANAATMTVQGSLTTYGAMMGGTLALVSGSTAFDAGVTLAVNNVLLSGSSTRAVFNTGVTMAGASWVQSRGTLAVGAGHTLTLSNRADTLSGAVVGAGTLALVDGVITMGAGAAVSIAQWSTSNRGTDVTLSTSLADAGGFTLAAGAAFDIASGDTLTLSGAISLGGTFAGPGTLTLAGSNLRLDDGTVFQGARVVLKATTVVASGQITNSSSLAATLPDMVIATSGATLTGGGQFNLADVTTNKIIGASASATLTNADNTITGAGAIGAGRMIFINKPTGVVDGTGAHTLIINTGAQTIINAGLIEATGAGGVVIDSTIANSGMLETNGGTLRVEHAVTGGGAAIVDGGHLDFMGAFNQDVTFAGTGVLQLAQSQSFGATITGLSHTGTNSLDLTDIAFKNAGQATFVDNGKKTGGVLTVTDGVHTAKINLVGDYAGATFTCRSDTQGGTIVYDPKAPALGESRSLALPMTQQQLGFVSAMASMVAPAGAPAPVGSVAQGTTPSLMSPTSAQNGAGH
jgi:hypothetical protein